jgi:hypothetical protein
MDDALVALKLTLDAIQGDNINSLRPLLLKFPLEKLAPTYSDNLLQQLLSVCTLLNRANAAKVIMTRFIQANAMEEQLPLFTSLFLKLSFSDDILAFLARLYPEFTFSEHMVNLIGYDQAPIVPRACGRLISIYGEQRYITYKLLYDMAVEAENDRMMDYLTSKMEETADYAPKPAWVQNFVSWQEIKEENGVPTVTETDNDVIAIARDRPAPPGPQDVPYEDEILLPETEPVQFELPPLDDMIDRLTDGLQFLGISFEDIDNARQILRTQLSIATTQEKYEILRPIMENRSRQQLSSDVVLFRIFGPANPVVDADLTTEGPCCEFGGCRMLTCNDFDRYDPDTDTFDEDADWFTGNCQVCFLKIENRAHAVRMPLVHGGWRGCYCSMECLRNDYSTTGPNIAQRAMIDRIEGQLDEFGIQDRLERPENETEAPPAPQVAGSPELNLPPEAIGLPELTGSQ